MFLKKLSLKVRLTILFVAIFGAAAGAYSTLLYYSLQDSLLQDFDNSLYNFGIDVSKSIETDDSQDFVVPLISVDDEKIFPFSFKSPLIVIRHWSGEIISRTENATDVNLPFGPGEETVYTTLNIPGADSPYRLMTFSLSRGPAPEFFLQIAVPMTRFQRQLEKVRLVISTSLTLLLLLGILLGLYFSSRALRPVRELIASISKVDVRDLSGRVPVPLARDEIRQLAETQNLLLDRIENAFQSQERFVADASHQLLTPLTILRGEIETRFRDESLLQEVDNLSKIVKDMLILARIDAGSDQMNFKPLDVDEILLDVISRCQKIARAKDITLKIDIRQLADKKTVEGDTDLLFNLFFNVIENAIKYSDRGTPVVVTMTWDEDETRVDVVNSGPGISPLMRTAVFERFSRTQSARETRGFGLGLSIAKKIADLHGFELLLLSDPYPPPQSGAHFQVRMRNLRGK